MWDLEDKSGHGGQKLQEDKKQRVKQHANVSFHLKGM